MVIDARKVITWKYSLVLKAGVNGAAKGLKRRKRKTV
jgi:hypothetical protein